MDGSDEYWMGRALQLARRASKLGEVPVGALLVLNDQVVGEGYNQPLIRCDPSAHAEVVALRRAAERVGNYRLPGATAYVTLEPCMMCAGALIHARVERLVVGALEPKAGAVWSHPMLDQHWLNHRIDASHGVSADVCGGLLKDFFAARRARRS